MSSECDEEGDKHDAKPPPPTIGEEPDLCALAREAIRIRAHCAELYPEEDGLDDFKFNPIGTTDTHLRLNVACDIMRAEASSKWAKGMLKDHFKRRQASYGISKKFARADASMLCRMWCHKMQYFCSIYKAWDNTDALFTEADALAYRPLDKFAEWKAAHATNRSAAARIQQWDELKPYYLMTDEEYRRG